MTQHTPKQREAFMEAWELVAAQTFGVRTGDHRPMGEQVDAIVAGTRVRETLLALATLAYGALGEWAEREGITIEEALTTLAHAAEEVANE